MSSLTSSVSLVAALLAAPALAQTAASDLTPEAAAEALGLRRADLVQVALAGNPGQPALVRFEYGGVDQRLDLFPQSIRADEFRLIEQRDGGLHVDLIPDPPTTYRGEAPTLPGSRVAAGWLEGGLHARILMPAGESLWLEPLEGRVPGAGHADYAVYRDADVRDEGHVCGVGPDEPQRTPHAHGAGQTQSGTVGGAPLTPFGGSFKVAQVGVDTDFEFYEKFGSISGTQNEIETVLNAMNLQYESEVGITHKITTVIVRTSADDPYTTSSAGSFLSQFRSHWQSQQQSVQRDVAHLFTGKNLDGPTIGVAYLGAVCSSFGYGLVQGNCCGPLATKTDLSAHELGHNWSADHCSCSSFTMNPSLTGSNQFSPTATIPQIVNFSNQIGCLGNGPSGSGTSGLTLCSNEAYGVGANTANIGNLFSIVEAVIGKDWVGTFEGFNGFSTGFLIVSASPASLNLGDGTVLVDIFNPTALVPVPTFFGNGAGVLPLPYNPGLVGATIYTQVGVVDLGFSGGYAFSNGLAVTLCE